MGYLGVGSTPPHQPDPNCFLPAAVLWNLLKLGNRTQPPPDPIHPNGPMAAAVLKVQPGHAGALLLTGQCRFLHGSPAHGGTRPRSPSPRRAEGACGFLGAF